MKNNKAISLIIIIMFMTLPIVSAQSITISDIKTTVIDDSNVLINWTTDVLSDSEINYGTTSNLDKTKTESTLKTKHGLKIEGLEAETDYNFKIKSSATGDSSESGELYFKTLPAVEITDVKVTTTTTLAIINFTTNSDVDAHVIYGETAEKKDKKSLDGKDVINKISDTEFKHTIEIESLEGDKDYFFQIIAEHVKSSEGGFKTKKFSENILEVNIPKYYNKQTITIEGKASLDGNVMLNVNSGSTDKRFSSRGTGSDGEFRFTNVKLLKNQKNELNFEVTDSSGGKKEYLHYIIVDTLEPDLKITEEPPLAVMEESNVEIKGFVNENVSLIYTVKTEKEDVHTRIIDMPRILYKSEGSATIQWNKTEHPEFKYYKVYRNDVLFVTPTSTQITDHFVSSNKQYKYRISMVDMNCLEGPLSDELIYIDTKWDKKDSVAPIPKEECEVSYQFPPETIDGAFSLNIAIEEGNNYITIIARDLAGNEKKESFVVIKDNTPPTITNIEPKEAVGERYFIYEGTLGTRVTISGTTEPNAKVELKIEEHKEKEVTADDSGYFEFKDVNIESMAKATHGDDFYLPKDPDYSGNEVNQDREDEFDIMVELVATDSSNLVSQSEMLRFTIGTCWSGEMKFNILPLTKYQMPTMLSPDRIEEGNEQISFILEFNYTGNSINQYIEDVTISPRCEATRFAEDGKYNLSCKLLTEGSAITKKSNPQKTLWFFTFQLKKMEEISKMTGISTKEFMEAMQGEIRFPFDVQVQYREEDVSKESRLQKKCMEISYLLDNSRIDPREVMPEWLLEGGLDATNQTIQTLDKIIPQIEQALKITAIATFAGFIAKIGARTIRKTTCRVESLQPNSDCTSPGSSGEKRVGWSTLSADEIKEKKYKQSDLTDEELSTTCPSCYAAWQEETEMNKMLRWAADRFLCHKTPAKWTESAEPEVIKKSMISTEQCYNNEKVKQKGIWITRITEAPEGKNPESHNTHFRFDGAQYVVDGTLADSKLKLTRVNAGSEPITEKHLTVAWIDGKAFMDFTDIPKYYKDKLGLTEDSVIDEVKETIPDSQCGDLVSKNKYKRDSAVFDISEFSYRENLLKMTCYNENRYFKDRDEPACFGQDNAIYKENLPMLTPQQHTTAFQCLCISGIYNRLKALKNIMAGLHNCFSQIKTSGKADAGVCKEIFTQYMCDALWQVVTYFTDDCAPVDPTKGGAIDGGVGSVKMTVQDMFSSLGDTANELNDEYGNAVLNNYLGGGTQGIMRKICLGSLTGDWGLDFESIIDASYSSSFNSYANAWPAKREYLGYTPYNDKARFEYRIAWNIAPGCDIDGYSVKLACINQETAMSYGVNEGLSCDKSLMQGETHPYRGCDCWGLPETKEQFFVMGDRLKQGVFEDKSHSKIIEESLRYDHVKIQLNIFDEKQRETCLPQGHKDGIWYFPIEDKTAQDVFACNFDPLSGTFKCEGNELLWDARGNAYFVGETTQPQTPEKRVYHPGDELNLETKIFNKDSSKPQCLMIELQNEYGHSLIQYKPWFIDINKNGSSVYKKLLVDSLVVKGKDFVVSPLSPGYGTLQYQGRSNVLDVEFTISFMDVDGDNLIKPDAKDTYIVYDENKKRLGNAQRVTEYITVKDVKVKIINIKMPIKIDSNGNEVYLKQNDFRISARSTKAESEIQNWILHMELRHTKEGDSDCSKTTTADKLMNDEYDAFKDIKIRIEPQGIPAIEKDRCVNGKQIATNKPCICGTSQELNCGTSERGMYCYAISGEDMQCHNNALCAQNVELEYPCACADNKVADSIVFGPGFCDAGQEQYCCEIGVMGKLGCASSLSECKVSSPGTSTSNNNNFIKTPEYSDYIKKASQATNIDACLIYGLMIAETGGKMSTSPTGYQGLMQSYSSNEVAPNSAEEQIMHGSKHLLAKYNALKVIPGFEQMDDKWKFTVAAYNAGQGVIINTFRNNLQGKTNPSWNEVKNAITPEILESFDVYKDSFIESLKYYKDYKGTRWNNPTEYRQYKITGEIIPHNDKTFSNKALCDKGTPTQVTTSTIIGNEHYTWNTNEFNGVKFYYGDTFNSNGLITEESKQAPNPTFEKVLKSFIDDVQESFKIIDMKLTEIDHMGFWRDLSRQPASEHHYSNALDIVGFTFMKNNERYYVATTNNGINYYDNEINILESLMKKHFTTVIGPKNIIKTQEGITHVSMIRNSDHNNHWHVNGVSMI